MRLRTQLRFLSLSAATVTTALFATAYFGFVHKSEAQAKRSFDRITVHRIDVLEPDGTPR